jgi:hypothetical protein
LSETISPNTTLGQYTIVSKIGEGGMGEVWRARDPKLGRDVAIKVLPAALSADKDRLARFEQEAQAAGALNHPNILSIFHIGTHEGAPYIVSELLEGESLRERMAGAPGCKKGNGFWRRRIKLKYLGPGPRKGHLAPNNFDVQSDAGLVAGQQVHLVQQWKRHLCESCQWLR